jgi:hypothetical protein
VLSCIDHASITAVFAAEPIGVPPMEHACAANVADTQSLSDSPIAISASLVAAPDRCMWRSAPFGRAATSLPSADGLLRAVSNSLATAFSRLTAALES